MIGIAFAAHLVLLGVMVMIGEFRLRPRPDSEAYTVEIVDDGELGWHMPAGLPKLDLGGSQPPARPARAAKAPPPRPQPRAEEPPPPPPEPEKPPEPPPPPPPPVKAEPPPPAPPQELAKAESEDDLVVATPVPSVRPTAAPTAAATAAPTAAPTARPTAAPTARPTAAPTARPAATARPAPSATRAAAPRPSATQKPAQAPRATQSPSIVVRGGPSPSPARGAPARAPQASPTSAAEARIAQALERVQRNVEGGETGSGSARSPGAQARGAGGVGGTDAPDPSRRVGIGPGRGGAGQLRGVEFLLYYNQMLARIRDAWVYTGAAASIEVKVRFSVRDDGSIAELRVTQPSGDPAYDASVVRAVRASSPLGAPPEKYRPDFSDVELTFQPGDLQVAP